MHPPISEALFQTSDDPPLAGEALLSRGFVGRLPTRRWYVDVLEPESAGSARLVQELRGEVARAFRDGLAVRLGCEGACTARLLDWDARYIVFLMAAENRVCQAEVCLEP